MDKKTIKRILESKGYRIISDSRAGNNYGDVLKLDNGCIVNCYDKGTFNCQGKNCAEIKNILDKLPQIKRNRQERIQGGQNIIKSCAHNTDNYGPKTYIKDIIKGHTLIFSSERNVQNRGYHSKGNKYTVPIHLKIA